MKKKVLALTFVLVGSFMLAGCSKDEILNHYNNIVQSAGSIELTGKSSLQGEKEKGIDDYTGTYTADYTNFSGTEYLFGGTSIKREAGKELSIDCTLEIKQQVADRLSQHRNSHCCRNGNQQGKTDGGCNPLQLLLSVPVCNCPCEGRYQRG